MNAGPAGRSEIVVGAASDRNFQCEIPVRNQVFIVPEILLVDAVGFQPEGSGGGVKLSSTVADILRSGGGTGGQDVEDSDDPRLYHELVNLISFRAVRVASIFHLSIESVWKTFR